MVFSAKNALKFGISVRVAFSLFLTITSYRVRQVRSELKQCTEIPKWLREVGSKEVLCASSFNWNNMETKPFNDTVPLSSTAQVNTRAPSSPPS